MDAEEDHYPSKLHQVSGVEPLGGYRSKVCFTNGAIGEWDFGHVVARPRRMVEPLRSPEVFAQVSLCDGGLEWPNCYDMCPDKLYLDMHCGVAFPADARLP